MNGILLNDATDDVIKQYFLNQNGYEMNILHVQILRERTIVLYSYEEETNLRELKGLCSSIKRHGREIINKFKDLNTTDKHNRTINRIKYRYRTNGIQCPTIINMHRYMGIRRNKAVTVIKHNMYVIMNGAGVPFYAT